MPISHDKFPIYYRVRSKVDGLLGKMKRIVFRDARYAKELDADHIKDLEVLYFFVHLERTEHSSSMRRLDDAYLLERQRLGDIQAYIGMIHEGVHPQQDFAELDRMARKERA